MKYCKSFPCSNIAISGGSYCADHQPVKIHRSDHHNPVYDTIRWQKFRRWYLSIHPLCEICERDGRTTPAVLVDHIHELKDGGQQYDSANVQALCRLCHARKTTSTKNRRESNRLHRIGSSGQS
jgi:5-methylcytosine-specific restriction enzyme A